MLAIVFKKGPFWFGWLFWIQCAISVESLDYSDLGCPKGYHRSPQWSSTDCLRMYSGDGLTWNDAQAVCESDGGNLVSIEDEFVSAHVAEIIKNESVAGHIWIGFYRAKNSSSNSSTLYKSDGSLGYKSLQFWHDNQQGNGECISGLLIHFPGDLTFLQWSYQNCDSKFPFVCRVKSCLKGQFFCGNGRCIQNFAVCDGNDTCGDESDEVDCPSRGSYFLSGENGVFPITGQPYLDAGRTTTWTVKGMAGTLIQLNVTEFDTQQDDDYVEVWFGGRTLSTSTYITRLSGKLGYKLPILYTSVNNYAVIRFISTPSHKSNGFSIKWNAISGRFGGTLDAKKTQQLLATPFYPNKYSSNLRITWIIKASIGKVITLQIMEIDIHKKDFLEIRDGSLSSGVLLASYPNKPHVNQFLISSTNSIHLYFKSQSLESGQGFKLSYVTGCTVAMTSSFGEITSPGFGLPGLSYPSGQNCMWTVTFPVTKRKYYVNLETLDFADDSLEIMWSNETNLILVGIGNNTSLHSGSDSNIGANLLVVKMRTNAVSKGSGFKLRFGTYCSENYGETGTTANAKNIFSSSLTSVMDVSCDYKSSFFHQEFATVDSIQLKCSRNGEWNVPRLPECKLRTCGKAPMVRNGLVSSSSGVNAEDTVTYECYPGWTMNGPSFITCLPPGQWSTPPTCKDVECPEPGHIANANRMSHGTPGTSYGSIVEYKCDEGYELLGSPYLLCEKNGNWSHPMPICKELSCKLPLMQNIQEQPSEILVGQSVQINCSEGYAVEGASKTSGVMMCRFNRTFDEIINCVDIDEQAHDNCSMQCQHSLCENTIGSFKCMCRHGYLLDPNGRNCSDVDECAVDNGGCTHGCLNEEGSYHCTCPDSLVMFTENGTSSFYIPHSETGLMAGDTYRINHTCVERQCGGLLSVEHGRYLTTRDVFYTNDTVELWCDIGYVVSGDSLVTCHESGNWMPKLPTCINSTCAAVFPDSKAVNPPEVTSNQSVAYLSMVTYECRSDVPHWNSTQLKRQCVYDQEQDSYKLHGDVLDCPVVDCREPVVGGFNPRPNTTRYVGQFTVNCTGLVGNSSRGDNIIRCDEDGHWDYGSIWCRDKSCSDPGTPPGAEQIVTGSYEVGQKVTFKCKRNGYELDNKEPLECIGDSQNATWSASLPTCIDVEPPSFTYCPQKTLHYNLYEKINLTEIIPQATDNSGMVKVTLEGYNISLHSDMIVAGSQVFTFLAEDYSMKNSQPVNCSVRVQVNEPPVSPVVNCKNDSMLPITNNTGSFSVEDVELQTSFKQPSSLVLTYNASAKVVSSNDVGQVITREITGTTPTGEVSSCTTLIYVTAAACREWTLPAPRFGKKTCYGDDSSGINCTLTCDDGFVFSDYTVTPKQYTCQPNGDWLPSTKGYYDCVSPRKAKFSLDVEVEYVFKSPSKFVVAPTQCKAYWNGQLDAKLQTASTEFTTECAGLNTSVVIKSGVITHFNETMAIGKFVLDLNYTSNSNNEECATKIGQYLSRLSSVSTALETLNGGDYCVTYNVSRGGVITKNYTCPLTETLVSRNGYTYCQPCPPGTMLSGASCVECPVGQYQDEVGMTSCKTCPTNTNTIKNGSMSSSECKAQCRPGRYSQSGLMPCMLCAEEEYAEGYGNTACTPCQSPQTTLQQTGRDRCTDVCDVGEYSTTSYQPCLKCPKNFYNPNRAMKACIECPSYSFTAAPGGINVSECLEHDLGRLKSDPVNQSCSGHGNYTTGSHVLVCVCEPGWTGVSCQTEIDFCLSQPCFNNGTCIPKTNGYSCLCPYDATDVMKTNLTSQVPPDLPDDTSFKPLQECKQRCLNDSQCACITYLSANTQCSLYKNCRTLGPSNLFDTILKTQLKDPVFSGELCETSNRKFCSNNLCKNGGKCQELLDGYRCLCPVGSRYTGLHCEEKINKTCSPTTCSNGGTCTPVSDSRYKCSCAPGFTGRTCDVVIDNCNEDSCLNNGMCRSTSTDFECECSPSFGGKRCQLIPDFCHNATCKNCITDYKHMQANCLCSLGYNKSDTGECSFVDFCLPGNPCGEGNNCTSQINGYACKCQPGKTGKNCQHDINECQSNPCLNGASCVDELNGYHCNCTSGFEGDKCGQNINDCSPLPCSSKGTLRHEDGVDECICHCKPGYEGRNCTVNIDDCASNPCLHNGTCLDQVNGFACNCTEGWTGDNCDETTDYCVSASCPIGATCANSYRNYFCSCPGTNDGRTCPDPVDLCTVSNPCLNNATCNWNASNPQDVSCNCTAGYTGETCRLLKDPCHESPCKNGGTCIGLSGDEFTCSCTEGYTGSDCGDTVPCPGTPCPRTIQNGASWDRCFCPCPRGEEDARCSGKVATDFDLEIKGLTSSAYQPHYSKVKEFSVILWVKVLKGSWLQPFFTLMHIANPDPKALQRSNVLTIDGTAMVFMNVSKSIDVTDSKQHFLGFSWSADTGKCTSYLDGIHNVYTCDQSSLAEYNLWSVLGDNNYVPGVEGTYNYRERPDRIHGQRNILLSQVNVFKSSLTVNQFESLFYNKSTINTNGHDFLYKWGTYHFYGDVRVLPPAESYLVKYPVVPQVSECPSYQVRVSQSRVVAITQTEPVFSPKNVQVLRPNISSSGVYSWGKHEIMYAATSESGVTTFCVYPLYVKRYRCLNPPDVIGGTQACDTTSVGEQMFKNCMVKCDAGRSFPTISSEFYTCGPQNFKTLQDGVKPLPYPSCGEEKPAAILVKISLVYDQITVPCSSTITKALNDNSISKFKTLGGLWEGLCTSDECGNVKLETKCGPSGGNRKKRATEVITTTVEANNVTKYVSGTNNVTLTAKEVLDNAILSGEFDHTGNVNNAFVNKDSFESVVSTWCPPSQVPRGDQCVECPPGTLYNNETVSCDACPVSQYQPIAGQMSCELCENGKTTRSVGSHNQTQCFDICVAGFYYDGSQCQPCDYGFYQPNTGSDYCISCGATQTTASTNSTSQDQCYAYCPSGFELRVADVACVKCSRGFYRNALEDDVCKKCDEGKITETDGSTSNASCIWADCPRGFHLSSDNTSCVGCEIGTYQPDKWKHECVKCSSQYTTLTRNSTSGGQCVFFCPEGKEENSSNQCLPCNRGWFKNSTTPGEKCTQCSVGTITAWEGSKTADQCDMADCQPGFHLSSDNTSCVGCEIGTYQPDKWMHGCIKCSSQYTTLTRNSTSDGQCVFFCGEGEEEVTSKRCTPCKRGWYKNSTAPGGSCVSCPSNRITHSDGSKMDDECDLAICLAGQELGPTNLTCVDCPYGFYQPVNAPSPEQNCLPCQDQYNTTVTAAKNISDCLFFCEPGQELVAKQCSLCKQGYFKQFQFGSCQICPDSNFINNGTGGDSASDCNIANCTAGSYRTNNNTCKPCDKGYYQEKQWQTSCVKCERINFSTGSMGSANKSDCKRICPSGEEDEGDVCKPCKIGYYKSSEVAAPCIICRAGYTTASTGSKSDTDCSLLICDPGSYRNSANLCSHCPVGKYQELSGQASCEMCPTGKTTKETNSTKPSDCKVDCPSGKQEISGQCVSCPLHTYRNKADHWSCVKCTNNKLTLQQGSTSLSDCAYEDCGKGEYLSVVSKACLTCVKGEYQDEVRQMKCKQCTPGLTTLGTGSMSTADCLGLCEVNKPCLNGGLCVPNGASFRCICPDGFNGKSCQTEADAQRTTYYIIGASVGGVLGLIVIIIIIALCIKKLRKDQQKEFREKISRFRHDTSSYYNVTIPSSLYDNPAYQHDNPVYEHGSSHVDTASFQVTPRFPAYGESSGSFMFYEDPNPDEPVTTKVRGESGSRQSQSFFETSQNNESYFCSENF